MKFKELLKVCPFEDIELQVIELECPKGETICNDCEFSDEEKGCTAQWVKVPHLIFEGKTDDAPIKVADYTVKRIMACNTRIRANYYTSHLFVEVEK